MVVPVLGRLDRRVPQPVPDIVEGVAVFLVEHPVGDAVPKRVGGHVLRVACSALNALWAHVGLHGQRADDTPDALGGHLVGLSRRKQRLAVTPAVVQVRPQPRDRVVGAVIDSEVHLLVAGRPVGGVVLLDMRRDRQVGRVVVEVEEVHVDLYELPDAEAGVVEHRHDGLVPVAQVRQELVALCGCSEVADLARLQPRFRPTVGIRYFGTHAMFAL